MPGGRREKSAGAGEPRSQPDEGGPPDTCLLWRGSAGELCTAMFPKLTVLSDGPNNSDELAINEQP